MDDKVQIVIPNWNKKDDLLECLDAVIQSTYTAVDVIVIDNGSNDGSAEAVMEKYGDDERLTIIKKNENTGAAGGFNTGIAEAMKRPGNYIWLLDNDVVVETDALEKLVEFMEQTPNAGWACSRMYYYDQPNKVQDEGGIIDRRSTSRGKAIVSTVYGPAGAMLVRKKAIKEIGLLDERFSIYCFDKDWCFRMREAGWSGYLVRGSAVRHKRKSGFAVYRPYYDTLHNLMLIKKHFYGWGAWKRYLRYLGLHWLPRRIIGQFIRFIQYRDIHRLQGAFGALLAFIDFWRGKRDRKYGL